MISHELLSKLLLAAKDRPLFARVDPRGVKGDTRRQHHGRCRVLALSTRDRAEIQPFGHRHSEIVELKHLVVWRSKLPSDLVELLDGKDGNGAHADNR